MELFDVSLLWPLLPGLDRDRRGDQVPKRLGARWLPSGAGPAGSSVAWREWFATKQVGFEFGSEFEGYDWVAGFASVGVLVGAVLGLAVGREAGHGCTGAMMAD